MTAGIQRAVRFPPDLHAQITAEAQRLGHPHSFSSVVVNRLRKSFEPQTYAGIPVVTDPRVPVGEVRLQPPTKGLGKGPTPARPKGAKSDGHR